MAIFEKSLHVPVSVDELFAWHERPGAFVRLSPPWDQPKVLSHTGGIRDGARVTLQVNAGPIPTTWEIEHRDYVANRQFRDVLLSGPFARFEHTHRFTPHDDGSSTLTDSIDYALPLGAAGDAVGGGFARSTLERVFAYRHALLASDLARHATFASKPRMRIAITGASGFIGSQLAAFLTTGGHEVLRIGRGAVQAGRVDVRWDLEHGTIDSAALEGVDAVIHLAGAPIVQRWTATHRAAIRTSRVEGTSLLAHALAKLTRKPRVLLSGSAIGIYGSRGDELLDERSARGTDYLADVASAWEAATAPAERAGIRVVHVRTGIVLGAAGGSLAVQAPLFYTGVGGPLSDGRQWMSPIALDDEIGALYHCLMRDDIAGAVNFVAPHAVTNAEFTRALATVVNRPAFFAVPAFALKLALGAELAEATALASQRVVPGVLDRTGYTFRHPDVEQMLRFELGRPA